MKTKHHACMCLYLQHPIVPVADLDRWLGATGPKIVKTCLIRNLQKCLREEACPHSLPSRIRSCLVQRLCQQVSSKALGFQGKSVNTISPFRYAAPESNRLRIPKCSHMFRASLDCQLFTDSAYPGYPSAESLLPARRTSPAERNHL